MHAFTILSGLLLSAVASAQSVKQTGPFNLVVQSKNSTLNNQLLSSCHSGAAQEALCILHSNNATAEYNEYYFNQSSTANSTDPGTITWLLPYNEVKGKSQYLSEPLVFTFDLSSNVAVPQFEPSDSYDVNAVFEKGLLRLQTYVDDTVSPPKYKTQNLDRWYICVTNITGYTYSTLSWAMGKYAPQNPSCQKVEVKMVPVKK